MKNLSEKKARDVFFEPMKRALETAKNRRQCKTFSDWQQLTAGVSRCLQPVQSGREWIQRLRQVFSFEIRVSSFFESLASDRRLRLVREVNESVVSEVDAAVLDSDDWFGQYSELDNFAVYAADGHYHKCSAHEDPIAGKRRPVGHFFAINLRTLSMRHLDLARPAPGRKTEHDITALKRLNPDQLRMGEPQGRKVVLVYDMAIIDFIQWYKWKQAKGIYIVTREKENMSLIPCGRRAFDRNDPRNNGVVSDEQAGTSKSTLVRRITYIDPVDGKKYAFITNEMTLPPGLIVFFYKKRWTIEKLFNQLKNKLLERQAWAKSPTAKCQHAVFLCLAHNLMLLLERKIEKEEGIADNKILRRRTAQVLANVKKSKAASRSLSPMLCMVHRSVERSLQFIRWLRWVLEYPTPWRLAMSQLRPLMEKYL